MELMCNEWGQENKPYLGLTLLSKSGRIFNIFIPAYVSRVLVSIPAYYGQGETPLFFQ